ncbi:MAG: putative metal dependent phosphohydrolase [Gammaproteobacteria bacterium]|nr:MAG: putative metal dependent phosphohydrolase [Gammaproteobacteria bacterium]TND06189.1 MAG: putative metal dependent phosphohydrolase [Gammaproteobacteria bacterium]
MAAITADDLTPGMVLGADAKHANGSVLLRTGTTLSEKHIKTFRAWGIAAVEIEGVSSEEVRANALGDTSDAAIELARDIMNQRFRHTDQGHPLMAELLQLCIRAQVQPVERD